MCHEVIPFYCPLALPTVLHGLHHVKKVEVKLVDDLKASIVFEAQEIGNLVGGDAKREDGNLIRSHSVRALYLSAIADDLGRNRDG